MITMTGAYAKGGKTVVLNLRYHGMVGKIGRVRGEKEVKHRSLDVKHTMKSSQTACLRQYSQVWQERMLSSWLPKNHREFLSLTRITM